MSAWQDLARHGCRAGAYKDVFTAFLPGRHRAEASPHAAGSNYALRVYTLPSATSLSGLMRCRQKTAFLGMHAPPALISLLGVHALIRKLRSQEFMRERQ